MRDKAVGSIGKLVDVMQDVQLENYIIPLLKKLTFAEWFTSRISAASLYPHVYAKVGEKHRKDLRAGFIKLCTDETPMVRQSCLHPPRPAVCGGGLRLGQGGAVPRVPAPE